MALVVICTWCQDARFESPNGLPLGLFFALDREDGRSHVLALIGQLDLVIRARLTHPVTATLIRKGWGDREVRFVAADWAAPFVGSLAVEVRADPAAARVDRGSEVGHSASNTHRFV